MSFLEDTQILQVLRGFNPWWRGGQLPRELHRPFRRQAFSKAAQVVKNPSLSRAVLLSGSRRVGKTTILQQLAEDLLLEGLAPYQLLYAPLDHPIMEMTSLNRLIEIYRTNILGGAERAVLLLDEITHAEGWGSWLKHVQDFFPWLKIAATGSIRPSTEETGRYLEISVPTLSFGEYLGMRGMQTDVALPLEAVPTLDRARQQHLLNSLLHLEPLFLRYLLQGGYPETALVEDSSLAQELLREECLDRVLRRDLAQMFGVRNVLDLEKLFVYLCLHSGESLGQETMAKSLQVSRVTLASHLQALEAGHLILPSHQIDQYSQKVQKSRSKYFVADPALRNAVLQKGEDALSDAPYLESLVEGCLNRHLATHYHKQRAAIGYWKSPRQGKELSALVMLPGRPAMAVQMKFRERPEILGSDALMDFLSVYKETPGFFITKSSRDFGPFANSNRHFRIPAFVFMYLLSNQ